MDFAGIMWVSKAMLFIAKDQQKNMSIPNKKTITSGLSQASSLGCK